jgi:hypothetical protein
MPIMHIHVSKVAEDMVSVHLHTTSKSMELGRAYADPVDFGDGTSETYYRNTLTQSRHRDRHDNHGFYEATREIIQHEGCLSLPIFMDAELPFVWPPKKGHAVINLDEEPTFAPVEEEVS